MIEMPKAYDFAATEERLYSWWEVNGWFKPEARPPDAKPFVISMPPPNVTGELHQGHALVTSIEDLMIRRARMMGRAALWVPGTDHAGIATQLQLEKQLKEQGLIKHDVGREAFLEMAWQWKEKYGGYITQQLRKLGASCDWDRERFTMDEGLSVAVRESFVRLYRMGLIYQGEYLVNWSPGLQTAVSDLEVEYAEEPGTLYYFTYPIAGGGSIPVATTRPETILADTALAVNPQDERYQQFIGRTALVPILEREIPVIADDYVDVGFGTGALKVTPGHDPNDFEIGSRHNLPIINAMNKDATMSAAAGPYEGLDRFECRQRLWADMEAAGLAIREEPYTLNVPRSQRGGEIIEPMVSRQWFVNAKPMAEMALAAVRSGRIKLVPDRFVRVWENWLDNIQPWCISRQLWWGHRIPVWTCGECGEQFTSRSDPDACVSCGGLHLEQDPDVLDTWFSSALWPFSTLGWPEATPDLARFYPTDVLETGYDILFFWVARMVMAGAMYTNDIPFHTVYLHGLVRDEHGKKMSKTAGNVVDPLEVMREYGTDALRFTLLTGGSPGNDLNLVLAKVASNRNFANKIWNIARFIVHNLGQLAETSGIGQLQAERYSSPDRWILHRMTAVIDNANRLYDSYQYGEAGRQIHDFLWGDFADWYIELAKVQLGAGPARAKTTVSVLVYVLDQSLRLLHPFIPFVTEAAWQHLKAAFTELVPQSQMPWPEALIIADWPSGGKSYPEASADFERLRELVRAVRMVRAEYNVEPGRFVAVRIAAGQYSSLMEGQRDILAWLARLDESHFEIAVDLEPPQDAVTVSLGDITAYLPLKGLLDVEKEIGRLSDEILGLNGEIERIGGLLASEFASRAPQAVVERERDKLERYIASRAELEQRLRELEGG